MNRFKLLATLLTASTLVLGGCNLSSGDASTSASEPTTSGTTSGTPAPTGTSTTSGTPAPTGTSTSEPIPEPEWPEEDQALMQQFLGGVIIPFCEGTWEWMDVEGKLYGASSDSSVEQVVAVFDASAATGWTYAGVDSYGDPLYEKAVGEDKVVANIYVAQAYPVVINAWYEEYVEPATDWSDEAKASMMEILGVILPYTEGVWETFENYGRFYAYGNGLDAADAQATFEAAEGWTYAGVDSYGDPLYEYALGLDKVVANVYEGSSVDVVIAAWFEEYIPVATEWTEEQADLMKANLGGVVLPFVEGSWEVEEDEGDIYAASKNVDKDVAVAAFEDSADWVYDGVDSYGDPLYNCTIETGVVTANIYSNNTYSCVIWAWFTPNAE